MKGPPALILFSAFRSPKWIRNYVPLRWIYEYGHALSFIFGIYFAMRYHRYSNICGQREQMAKTCLATATKCSETVTSVAEFVSKLLIVPFASTSRTFASISLCVACLCRDIEALAMHAHLLSDVHGAAIALHSDRLYRAFHRINAVHLKQATMAFRNHSQLISTLVAIVVKSDVTIGMEWFLMGFICKCSYVRTFHNSQFTIRRRTFILKKTIHTWFVSDLNTPLE